MYETKISDAKWIAYDIPGNIGCCRKTPVPAGIFMRKAFNGFRSSIMLLCPLCRDMI